MAKHWHTYREKQAFVQYLQDLQSQGHTLQQVGQQVGLSAQRTNELLHQAQHEAKH